MLDDIACARRLGTTGVVFGCLTADPAMMQASADIRAGLFA